MWSAITDRVRSWAHHPDPLVELANRVALLVASSQPFYPLYLYWLVSDEIAASLFTFLSTPFFIAVPAVSRWNGVAGRALLPLAGIANTVLCLRLFGDRSAVEMFLVPCALLALLLFRPRERIVGLALAGIALAVHMLPAGQGVPWHVYGDGEYAALARLNILSAAMLSGVVALMVAGLYAAAESRASARDPGGREKSAG